MVNFMRDPTGDIPWEEDPTAGDVVHVDNKQVRLRIITMTGIMTVTETGAGIRTTGDNRSRLLCNVKISLCFTQPICSRSKSNQCDYTISTSALSLSGCVSDI